MLLIQIEVFGCIVNRGDGQSGRASCSNQTLVVTRHGYKLHILNRPNITRAISKAAIRSLLPIRILSNDIYNILHGRSLVGVKWRHVLTRFPPGELLRHYGRVHVSFYWTGV
jgi:hypothetical protein